MTVAMQILVGGYLLVGGYVVGYWVRDKEGRKEGE